MNTSGRDARRNPDIFLHTTGLYDVSAMWAFVRARRARFKPRRARWDEPGVLAFTEHVLQHYSWSPERLAALAEAELAKPLLGAEQEDGRIVLVDGTHRLLHRFRESERYTHFDIIIMPRNLGVRFRATYQQTKEKK